MSTMISGPMAAILAKQRWDEMTCNERLEELDSALRHAIKQQDDEAASQFIQKDGQPGLLRSAIYDVARPSLPAEATHEAKTEHLLHAYSAWLLGTLVLYLPKPFHGYKWEGSSFGSISPVRFPMPKAATAFFRELASCWVPQKTSWSLDIFRFLCAAYAPHAEQEKEHLSKTGNSWDAWFCGSPSVSEIQKLIEELIRKKTEDARQFTPEILVEWANELYTPPEIRKILFVARTRNGGSELWNRDIESFRILGPLYRPVSARRRQGPFSLRTISRRSESAFAAVSKFVEQVSALDEALTALIDDPVFESRQDTTGLSGSYYRVECRLHFHTTSSVEVNVSVGVSTPTDVFNTISGDIVSAVSSYMSNRGKVRPQTLDLIVEGGASAPRLSRTFVSESKS